MAPFDPSISVVIPTLDAGRAFGTTLHRLTRQGRVADEILVVDGGSHDVTRHIVSQFAEVRWVDSGVRPGPRAWNHACAAGQGDLIVFLSQDALPTDETWLEQLIAPMKNPAIAAAYGRQQIPSLADPIGAFRFRRRFPRESHQRRACFGDPVTLDSLHFSIANAVLRRSVWRGIRFNEHLPIVAEREWARQVLFASYTVAYAPEAAVERTASRSLKAAFREGLLGGWTAEYLGPETGTLYPEAEHFVRAAAWNLLRRLRLDQIPYLALEDASKRYGYKFGRRLHRLAPSVRRKIAPEVAAEHPRRPLKELERAA